MSAALEVTEQFGAKSVQIAYVMQKALYVFPIVGRRKVEHLEADIEDPWVWVVWPLDASTDSRHQWIPLVECVAVYAVGRSPLP